MEPAWLDLDDAELMAVYARYWLELTKTQEIVQSLHREMERRDLWPYSRPNEG